MRFDVVTLFPEMFDAVTGYGITRRAIDNQLLIVEVLESSAVHIHDKHQTVDDRPYGGGPGMLMMMQPLRDAIQAAKLGRRSMRS